MSDEIYQQRQCQTCWHHFPTNGELRAHIERYRIKERFLSAEVDKCRAHSSQLLQNFDTPHDDDNDKCEEENDDEEASNVMEDAEGPPGWYCPAKDCKRNVPFAKKKQLRRHFAIHVDCEEVCVFCFRVFRLASQYIGHAQSHRTANQTKNSYTSQICDTLRKRVDDELCLLNKRNEKIKRRLPDGAEDMAPTSVAHKSRRSNRYGVNGTAADSRSTAAFDELTGSTPTQAGNGERAVAGGGFTDIPIPAIYARSQPLDELGEDYGAPVFWNMTFPPSYIAQQSDVEYNAVHSNIASANQPPSIELAQTMQAGGGVVFHEGPAGYQGP